MKTELTKLEIKFLTISLTILFCFIIVPICAQINKGSVQLSIEGSYMKAPMESGVLTNQFSQLTKQGTIDMVGEYFISDKFSVGIGVNYQSQKDKRYNSVYILNTIVQEELLEIEQSVWLPMLTISYYQPIVNKLYLSCSTSFSFGTIKSESKSFVISATPTLIDTSNRNNVSYTEENDYDFVGFGLSPRLNYFVTNRFGLFLGFGSIEYSLIDGETDNSSFQLDFVPRNWSFGVNFIF